MDGVYFIFQKKLSRVGKVSQRDSLTAASADNGGQHRGTQRPNVSKYARSVSDGFFYALEACLVNLELPEKLFICLDVLVKLWSSRSVFGDFFVSSESLSYPHGTARVRGHEVTLLS